MARARLPPVPAHLRPLRSLPKLRTLNRLTGAASCNGLSMVQRQWSLCALQRVTLIELERIILYGMVQLRSVARQGAMAGARSMDVSLFARPWTM